MAEAVDAWLLLKESDPGARANSIHAYRSRAAHARSALGTIPVAAIRPEHLTGLVEGLRAAGYRPATIQGIYAVVTASLRHARRRRVIKALPLPDDGPGIGVSKPRRHDLTLRQVEDIIDRVPGVWGRVCELVFLTGLRWGEVVAVRQDDIDRDTLRVRATAHRYGGTNEPKTEAGFRALPLSPRARELFLGMTLPVGGDYRRAREALVAAMDELHRPGMGWHSIRAAHATLLDAAGVSLRDAAARMGHGHNFAQTLAYHVRSENRQPDVIDAARRRVRGSEDGPSAGSVRAGR